jgi:hypothetical protein
MSTELSKMTSDHETIRRWVEDRGGRPVIVKSTHRGGKETGIIRIDFPGYSGKDTLEEISWDEFFRKFDDAHLAFVYEDETSTGQKSNFNTLVRRDNA